MVEDPLKIEKPKGLLAGTMQATENQQPRITASNQDWAKGDLKIQSDGVYFTPPGKGSATVAGQLSGLLASNSPYVNQARESAKQTANRRGLLNSTMAASAGEKAAIESALPIAQQDAGYYQQGGLKTLEGDIQKGLYETQGDINSRLQKEQGDIQTGLYETQGDISSRLSKQEFGQQGQLKQAEYAQQTAMKQADIDWQKLDLDARMQVEYDRMGEENRTRFDETTNMISEDYMNDYIEIMMNPNFKTAEDRRIALERLAENTRQRMDNAGKIAGITLTWDIPSPPAAAPPAADSTKDEAKIKQPGITYGNEPGGEGS